MRFHSSIRGIIRDLPFEKSTWLGLLGLTIGILSLFFCYRLASGVYHHYKDSIDFAVNQAVRSQQFSTKLTDYFFIALTSITSAIVTIISGIAIVIKTRNADITTKEEPKKE